MRDRSLFWRQLGTLLESGVPILAALHVLEQQSSLGPVAAQLGRALQAGHRLSEGLASHPGVFAPVDRAMIRVGEGGGSLVKCIDRLAGWLERDCEIRLRTRKALQYPLFVLAVSGLLVMLLVGLVVPAFRGVLQDLNAPLPLPTRMLLGASGWLRAGWPVLLGLAMAGFAGYVLREWARTPSGERQLFSASQRVPLLGRLLASAAMARYTDAFHLMLEAGTDILQALRLAADVSGHPLLIEDAPHLAEALRDGCSLSAHMRENPQAYPRSLAQLIASGEESDRLGRFVIVARRSYQLETELMAALLQALLEPVLITFVAGVVVGVVLALLLPVYASLQAL